MTRFIFITGGVASSLGKGLASASLGSLLQARGYKVHLRKFEPYINVDPGTMSPFQHGEVYVTEDGAETDLDLGHYERFTGINCNRSDAVSTGQIYSHVIAKERRGDYLGATVQVIPHITDSIQEFITQNIDADTDFVLIEIGGTVGDIEGLPFLEAIRQFVNNVGSSHALYMHLTLIPYIASAGEIKTKPAQHSVKELLHVGIQPNILLCRCEHPIPLEAKRKLALFCNIKPQCVIEAVDVKTIYQAPLYYADVGLDVQVLEHFKMHDHQQTINLEHWHEIVRHVCDPDHQVTIAVVGKYTGLKDAYKSLDEALIHGGIANRCKVNIKWINAEQLDNYDYSQDFDHIQKHFDGCSGILVPGGYGVRGAAGKMIAIRFARENKIPFFGICFGMQLAIVEAARQLLNLATANTTEFGPTCEPVVGLLTEWQHGQTVQQRRADNDLGGTMRLGAYDCVLTADSHAHRIYGQSKISERHRHRYEVNMDYQQRFAGVGMHFSGLSPDGKLPELIELSDHPWFIGIQAHPELKSRPFNPHCLFKSFIEATLKPHNRDN